MELSWRFRFSAWTWYALIIRLCSSISNKYFENGSFQQFQSFSFDVVIAVALILIGISNALLYCYFGKIATESYEKMHDYLFKLKWYKLPIATQKYFILMAANMQKPLCYHGFGVLYLNLETFTRVRVNFNLICQTNKWILICNYSHSLTDAKISVVLLHGDQNNYIEINWSNNGTRSDRTRKWVECDRSWAIWGFFKIRHFFN